MNSAISSQLVRIQSSQRFVNAPRLCQLLDYLVENSTRGDDRNLLEFTIGVEVFDRGAGFDPQSDTIVRVTAGRLRRFLAEYYNEEGRADPIRFYIPTGHYRVQISPTRQAVKPGTRAWLHKYRNRLALPTAAGLLVTLLVIIEYSGSSAATGKSAVAAASPAMKHILLGRELLHRRGPGDLHGALAEFELAVREDASSIDAWIGLAWALRVLPADDSDQYEKTLPRQYQALNQALALDPHHPLANARMASLHYYEGNLAGAQGYLRTALRYGRDNALVLGMIAMQEHASGNLQRAIALMREAIQLPPLDIANSHNLGTLLFEAGKMDEALDAFYRAEKLSPLNPATKAMIVKVLVLNNELRKAEERLRQFPRGAERQQAMTLVYHAAGREEDSRRSMRALADQPRSIEQSIMLAEALAFTGEHGRAMDEIEAVYERIQDKRILPTRSTAELRDLLNSPLLVSLHDHPRYLAWADKARALLAMAKPTMFTMAALEEEISLRWR